mmetsp:Transcript_44753/g.83521  ORF Transcript_44753/g.83521 Transcript_44753/m.83521 type:complete len:247 (-) Transcript_44753:479-1219(-)
MQLGQLFVQLGRQLAPGLQFLPQLIHFRLLSHDLLEPLFKLLLLTRLYSHLVHHGKQPVIRFLFIRRGLSGLRVGILEQQLSFLELGRHEHLHADKVPLHMLLLGLPPVRSKQHSQGVYHRNHGIQSLWRIRRLQQRCAHVRSHQHAVVDVLGFLAERWQWGQNDVYALFHVCLHEFETGGGGHVVRAREGLQRVQLFKDPVLLIHGVTQPMIQFARVPQHLVEHLVASCFQFIEGSVQHRKVFRA